MVRASFGFALSVVAALTATYEAVAIKTPLPTISRVLQGARDAHPILKWGLFVGFGLMAAAVVAFGIWVGYHLIRQARSTL